RRSCVRRRAPSSRCGETAGRDAREPRATAAARPGGRDTQATAARTPAAFATAPPAKMATRKRATSSTLSTFVTRLSYNPFVDWLRDPSHRARLFSLRRGTDALRCRSCCPVEQVGIRVIGVAYPPAGRGGCCYRVKLTAAVTARIVTART